MTTKRATQRVGFTLVELLVVIAIIGMLAGLMLPAVQQAREAGRRAECTNNQRNIALALINYEGARKAFPGFRQKAGDLEGASWYYTIFPYIEQTNLYDLFQSYGNATTKTFHLARYIDDTNGRNGHAIGVFKCSSSGRRENADADYVVNCGPTNVIAKDATWNLPTGDVWKGGSDFLTVANTTGARTFERGGHSAVFFNKTDAQAPNTTSSVNLEYIASKNGTSNTLLTSENTNGGYWTDTEEWLIGFCYPNSYVWTGKASDPVDSNPYDVAGNTSIFEPTGTASGLPTKGFPFWINANKTNTSARGYQYARPSSNHPGVVVSSFCDGSVRPVSDEMDRGTFINAMQPGGNGIFGANAFN